MAEIRHKMTRTAKRKVRRNRRWRKPNQWFGSGLLAPIVGEYPGVMHHFMPVETGLPLPFQNLEQKVYLRTFQVLSREPVSLMGKEQ